MNHQLRTEELQTRHSAPLSFTVGPGEILTISGNSGSGKSLLLRALADLDPHSGEVFLGWRRQAETPPDQWRRWVGWLPAESHWWRELVGEHFPELDQTAGEWLERLGFSPAVLEWPVSRLSTGERQRLGLLRLLTRQPRALLLDEPTSNLDHANVALVEGVLREYQTAHEVPIIWVSHDPAQATRLGANRMILEEGQLRRLGENG